MRNRRTNQLAAGAMGIMLLLSVILLNAIGPSLMAASDPIGANRAGGQTVTYLA